MRLTNQHSRDKVERLHSLEAPPPLPIKIFSFLSYLIMYVS